MSNGWAPHCVDKQWESAQPSLDSSWLSLMGKKWQKHSDVNLCNTWSMRHCCKFTNKSSLTTKLLTLTDRTTGCRDTFNALAPERAKSSERHGHQTNEIGLVLICRWGSLEVGGFPSPSYIDDWHHFDGMKSPCETRLDVLNKDLHQMAHHVIVLADRNCQFRAKKNAMVHGFPWIEGKICRKHHETPTPGHEEFQNSGNKVSAKMNIKNWLYSVTNWFGWRGFNGNTPSTLGIGLSLDVSRNRWCQGMGVSENRNRAPHSTSFHWSIIIFPFP